MKNIVPNFQGGVLKNQLSYHKLKKFYIHPLHPTSKTGFIKINYASYIEDLCTLPLWGTENLIIIMNSK